MAGSYADPIDHRMAYDRDGSVVGDLNVSTGSVTTVSTATYNFNTETPGPPLAAGEGYAIEPIGAAHVGVVGLGILFPELRNVSGYFIVGENIGIGAGSLNLQWSANTTNLIDGTWTTVHAYTNSGYSKAGMRTPTTCSITGAKAIRFTMQNATSGSGWNTVELVHVYGKPSTGQAPNRLLLWDPSLNQRVAPAHFDWGDVPQGQTVTQTFRVKNPSATLTAEDVALTLEALTDTSPTTVSQHTLSADGVTFSTSLNIGDLGPGDISSVITLKRITSGAATLGLWWLRLVAHAASWV